MHVFGVWDEGGGTVHAMKYLHQLIHPPLRSRLQQGDCWIDCNEIFSTEFYIQPVL